MNASDGALPEILHRSPVRVLFGRGQISELGHAARSVASSLVGGASTTLPCVLLVTDPGIVAAGHADRAVDSLTRAGLEVVLFDEARENPTTEHVAAGIDFASGHSIDLIIGLGGGSAMDCAKGINLILTNGGEMADYWGVDKASEPMLPLIAVPTTAGTGSEAQSFALIADPKTHQKMACGDRRLPTQGGLRPHVAVLDPDLTLSQPAVVAAAAGIDAVAHAVETAATTERNETSRRFSTQAWRLLRTAYEKAIRQPTDDRARADMLLGAHLGGAAIEFSMLGAAHALANPLTARCDLMHGHAVGLMLPHVVRFNTRHGLNPYADLCADPDELVHTLESLLDAGRLRRKLSNCGVAESILPELARLAAEQWTVRFNPTPVSVDELLKIYESAK